MNCDDQNKALYTIRNSNVSEINKLKNGKIIKNLSILAKLQIIKP